MSLSGDPLATYQTSRWQRGLAVFAAAGLLFIIGIVAVGPDPSWATLLQFGTTGVALVAAAAYGLHAQLEVYETGLRRVRPLRTDEPLHFDEVERALLPLTSRALLLFTGTGRQLALRIGGDEFEDFDRLVRQVLRRLPDTAEIEDPAGRADDL